MCPSVFEWVYTGLFEQLPLVVTESYYVVFSYSIHKSSSTLLYDKGKIAARQPHRKGVDLMKTYLVRTP